MYGLRDSSPVRLMYSCSTMNFSKTSLRIYPADGIVDKLPGVARWHTWATKPLFFPIGYVPYGLLGQGHSQLI
jgi:hypothetical protein